MARSVVTTIMNLLTTLATELRVRLLIVEQNISAVLSGAQGVPVTKNPSSKLVEATPSPSLLSSAEAVVADL